MRFPAKLILYLLMQCFALSAHAEPHQGFGYLCDRLEQVIAFARAGGGLDGIQTVNAREPNACAYVHVRFTDPQLVGETDLSNWRVAIVQITVTAFAVNGTWYELAPSLQYAIVNLGDSA